MTTAGKGKADYLDLGTWNAQCFECGRKFKASELRRHWQGYWVCEAHYEPRQPQDFVRGVPDKQAPPWTQPMPADTFVGIGIATEDDLAIFAEDFSSIITEGSA